MPLVADSNLPTFERLREEGRMILPQGRALHQEIRELHIGLLNMMPDAALEATERQFFRLIGESNQIAQFHIHPFTLPELPRNEKAAAHIKRYYKTPEQIKEENLDALIITGANVTQPDLSQEPFWAPLDEIINWAYENVTSTLCSCLATHAYMQLRHGQKRTAMAEKLWGVFQHVVTARQHPVVNGINTVFDAPHSRYNTISREQFDAAGMIVLAETRDHRHVHMAASPDGFRVICLQGHPEYDTVSLLKEYKRELALYSAGERADEPPYPAGYFSSPCLEILESYKATSKQGQSLKDFPEGRIEDLLENSWRDTAKSVMSNWIGQVYQTTNVDRKIQFMEGIDPGDPLGLKTAAR